MKRTTKMLKRFYYKKLLCWQNETNTCTCRMCEARREKRITILLLIIISVLLWAFWPMIAETAEYLLKAFSPVK